MLVGLLMLPCARFGKTLSQPGRSESLVMQRALAGDRVNGNQFWIKKQFGQKRIPKASNYKSIDCFPDSHNRTVHNDENKKGHPAVPL